MDAGQRDTTTDGLFIGEPALEPGVRQVVDPADAAADGSDGRFAGVLVASIDPGHFEAFYTTMEIGDGAAVTLVGDDGVLQARQPQRRELPRPVDAPEPISSADADRLPARDGSRASPIDGVMRMTSFRAVADYPLTVMVSLPMSGVRGVDDARRDLWLALASMLTLGVIAAVVRSIANQRSLDLALEALRDSEAGASAKSRRTRTRPSSTSSQGIMMIDARHASRW